MASKTKRAAKVDVTELGSLEGSGGSFCFFQNELRCLVRFLELFFDVLGQSFESVLRLLRGGFGGYIGALLDPWSEVWKLFVFFLFFCGEVFGSLDKMHMKVFFERPKYLLKTSQYGVPRSPKTNKLKPQKNTRRTAKRTAIHASPLATLFTPLLQAS